MGDPNKAYQILSFTSRNAGSKEEELARSSSSHSVKDRAAETMRGARGKNFEWGLMTSPRKMFMSFYH